MRILVEARTYDDGVAVLAIIRDVRALGTGVSMQNSTCRLA